MGCNQIFDRVLPGQPDRQSTCQVISGFFSPIFFNPARFYSRITRQAGLDFKIMAAGAPMLSNKMMLFT
jgi:hypothetical protein